MGMIVDRGGRRIAAAFALTCIGIVGVGAANTAADNHQPLSTPNVRDVDGVYIVRMAERPVVAYKGGLSGLSATAPAKGKKVNPNSAHVRKYVQFLHGRHAAVLAASGAGPEAKFYDYEFSFNGFAATLTGAQASKLRTQPGVLSVSLDQFRQPTTDNTPGYLGLSAPGGVWDQLGGQGMAGEDVVIGIIDTGIWPEHPSFSDQADLVYRPGNSGNAQRVYGAPPSDWFGTCQTGERWSKNHCNNKLIGARWFVTGLTRHGVVPADYASARDRDGHGTHTASTAGGNAGVDPSIFGRDLGVSTISGMAPRARIAAYKGCFNDAGCVLTDLVEAIDTAVADGVDVINYSIGSDAPEFGDDDIAFLFAADAGVYVATSAGNAGPDVGTVGSPASSPWVTAVGASTHDRYFLSTIALGDATSHRGGSVGTPLGETRLVDATDDPGVTPTVHEFACAEGGLDPSVVAGAIVLCERKTGFPRISHGAAVAAAGGVGMILFDPPQVNVRPTDNHHIPTVHVHEDVAVAIETYIESAGDDATASFSGGTAQPNDDAHAPSMAVFSSRGPNGAAPDIIKPDVTAPGVQILAGNSPTPFLGAPGELFQAIQGTSMSSPHVAGVGALLRHAHPDWSPAMIKSALMTTGSQDVTKQDSSTAADPLDMGGGHIQPNAATDPGLVYDAGFLDYVAFLCGNGNLAVATCTDVFDVEPIDPSDLNLASIGIGELAGSQVITREVTNVGAGTATYNASASVPGVDAAVSPSSLTLAPGESATFTVTFTVTPAAALGKWAFGSLTWTDGAHNVRSPIAVLPVALAAPAEVSGTGQTGGTSYDVKFGYTGTFNALPEGLAAADVQAANVVDDPANEINVALESGVGITLHTVHVDDGSSYFRTALFDDENDGAVDDLDLYVFDPDGNFVGGSGSPTATEQVDVVSPAEGDWTVVVHGWQTDGPDTNYDLFNFVVNGDADNMTVIAPTTATLGETATIDLAWTLAEPGRYLGLVRYDDGTNDLGFTLVSVNTAA
jgi:hypothetical protein